MIPWRPLMVFLAISVGTTTAIALLCAAMGWSVNSPAWALLAPIAMWAPALGRVVSCRTVDRGFRSTLTLRRWGVTGARVILEPLAIPLAVYGTAYVVAWSAGFVHWSPGGGKWTTGPQIAANLLINLSILGVFGTFTAMGEEIGWRGYLQPRLDAAGARWSVVIVWLCQIAYHAPLMAGAGYLSGRGLVTGFALFAVGDLPVSFLLAWMSYRARSLWPAVFLHSFHNTVSQWLFPKFFAGGNDELWLGEGGLLPLAGYVVLGGAVFLWMRWRGGSWQALVGGALTTSTA
jgi:membrane protease YdiL (CAAX protease family)